MEEAKLVMCINVECNSNGTTNGVRCSTYQQCHGKRKHQDPFKPTRRESTKAVGKKLIFFVH